MQQIQGADFRNFGQRNYGPRRFGLFAPVNNNAQTNHGPTEFFENGNGKQVQKLKDVRIAQRKRDSVPDESEYLELQPDKKIHITRKVLIPDIKVKNVNIAGKLIGPGGATLQELCKRFDCRIAVCGANSTRDRVKEIELHSTGDPQYAHFGEPLHAQVNVIASPSVAYKRLAEVLEAIQAIFDGAQPIVMQQKEVVDKAMAYSSSGSNKNEESESPSSGDLPSENAQPRLKMPFVAVPPPMINNAVVAPTFVMPNFAVPPPKINHPKRVYGGKNVKEQDQGANPCKRLAQPIVMQQNKVVAKEMAHSSSGSSNKEESGSSSSGNLPSEIASPRLKMPSFAVPPPKISDVFAKPSVVLPIPKINIDDFVVPSPKFKQPKSQSPISLVTPRRKISMKPKRIFGTVKKQEQVGSPRKRLMVDIQGISPIGGKANGKFFFGANPFISSTPLRSAF